MTWLQLLCGCSFAVVKWKDPSSGQNVLRRDLFILCLWSYDTLSQVPQPTCYHMAVGEPDYDTPCWIVSDDKDEITSRVSPLLGELRSPTTLHRPVAGLNTCNWFSTQLSFAASEFTSAVLMLCPDHPPATNTRIPPSWLQIIDDAHKH